MGGVGEVSEDGSGDLILKIEGYSLGIPRNHGLVHNLVVMYMYIYLMPCYAMRGPYATRKIRN